jgi:hypothetical protein
MDTRKSPPEFLLRVKNGSYPALLEMCKVYQAIPDESAAVRHFLHIIDESGDDYLYPDSYFVPVELP